MTQHHIVISGSRVRTILVGAVSAVLIATMALAGTPRDGRTYLRFSHPVALPGVVLPAGSFTFELVNPFMGHNVVRVLNRDRTRIHFTGIAQPVSRPAGLSTDRVVTLGTTEIPGDAPPILTWYPSGMSYGLEFVYR